MTNTTENAPRTCWIKERFKNDENQSTQITTEHTVNSKQEFNQLLLDLYKPEKVLADGTLRHEGLLFFSLSKHAILKNITGMARDLHKEKKAA